MLMFDCKDCKCTCENCDRKCCENCMLDCDECVSRCHDKYVERSKRLEEELNKKLFEEYGKKKLSWHGLKFAWCYVRKGNYVISLSPTTFAECIDKNIYMLRHFEKYFEEVLKNA